MKKKMVHFHHLAVENSGPEDQGQLRPELSGHHVFFFLGCGCDADGVTGRKNAVRDETRYDWDRRVVQDEWRQWGMGFSVTYWAPKKPVTK